MNKVKGTENPADMNTKGLSGEEIAKYTKMLGMGYQEGRSKLAPEVQQIINQTKCTRYNSSSSKVTHRVRFERQSRTSEHSNHLHVFDDCGENNYTCGCDGCWMYCESNSRS